MGRGDKTPDLRARRRRILITALIFGAIALGFYILGMLRLANGG